MPYYIEYKSDSHSDKCNVWYKKVGAHTHYPRSLASQPPAQRYYPASIICSSLVSCAVCSAPAQDKTTIETYTKWDGSNTYSLPWYSDSGYCKLTTSGDGYCADCWYDQYDKRTYRAQYKHYGDLDVIVEEGYMVSTVLAYTVHAPYLIHSARAAQWIHGEC